MNPTNTTAMYSIETNPIKKLRKVMLAGLMTLMIPILSASPTTSEQQRTATPDQVLAELMAGNERFVANRLEDKDWQAQVRATAAAQYPKAVILSCLDSRVPVEAVFDQGIGDVFVARVAGNIEGEQTLGSMEFATQVVGAKLVMVLGHESCGAVIGAISGAKLGHLTSLLEEIHSCEKHTHFHGEKSAGNPDYVDAVVRQNVLQTVADIRARSEVLRNLEKEGKIQMVPAYYQLKTGKVTILH